MSALLVIFKVIITPKDVINYLFTFDKSISVKRNKLLLGLVANKLLLALKNKKGFLEYLVMKSNPSIHSILNNIKIWMKENSDEKVWCGELKNKHSPISYHFSQKVIEMLFGSI